MNRILSCLGVLACFGMFAQAAEHTKDSLAMVKQALDAGKAIVVDVREPDEWQQGHLQGAKHLPLSALRQGVSAEAIRSLLPAGKTIYIHCAAGGRCLPAADILKKAGIESRPLRSGYDELLRAGFSKAK